MKLKEQAYKIFKRSCILGNLNGCYIATLTPEFENTDTQLGALAHFCNQHNIFSCETYRSMLIKRSPAMIDLKDEATKATLRACKMGQNKFNFCPKPSESAIY